MCTDFSYLEANAGPDLKQTGTRLNDVIRRLMDGIGDFSFHIYGILFVVSVVVDELFPEAIEKNLSRGNLSEVYSEVGPSWGTSNLKFT